MATKTSALKRNAAGRAAPVARAAAPMARRKRRTPEEIKERLLDAATAEFKRSGFSGATTALIASKADVTEAQLFRYFGSKASLFRAAIFEPLNKHFSDFQSRRLNNPDQAEHFREEADTYITELQQFISEHSKMLMSLVVAQTYAPGATQSVDEIDGLHAYFERGAAMMKGRMSKSPKVAPELMVRVSFAAVMACVMFKDWMFPKGLASEEDIRNAIIDFTIDGINANSDSDIRTQASKRGRKKP